MIEDYRKELTKSMRAQLDDNQDLKDALQQIKDDKQKMQDTMINHLRNDIEKDKIGQDQNYILNMSEQDLDNAGLSLKATREYKSILNDVQQFKDEYNKAHPQDLIKQQDYNGEITADDTSKLINEGVEFERHETIKSRDINQLTIATDPNFDFDGYVYVNDKKYDIKNQDIKLDTTKKSYDVEIKGTAKLKMIVNINLNF